MSTLKIVNIWYTLQFDYAKKKQKIFVCMHDYIFFQAILSTEVMSLCCFLVSHLFISLKRMSENGKTCMCHLSIEQ